MNYTLLPTEVTENCGCQSITQVNTHLHTAAYMYLHLLCRFGCHPVYHASPQSGAWPRSLSSDIVLDSSLVNSRQQRTHRPVSPSSAAAWPLSLQLTRWPVGRSLICCSLASLSSADSVASRSLICCSLASLSSADSVASRSRW